MPRRLMFALLALGVSGCATLNESQCRSVDWYQLGSHDGADGYSRERLEEHRKACSEFGLSPDDSAWRKGYDEGLERYCTVDSGYRVGRGGGGYARVCPVDEEREFLAAYDLGRETYGVEQEFNQVSQNIDAIENRLALDKKLDDATRRDLRYQLDDLYGRSIYLRRSRDRLEDEWRYRFQR